MNESLSGLRGPSIQLLQAVEKPLPAAEHGEARRVGSGEATSEARQERRTHRCVIGFRHQAACGTLLRTFPEVPVTTVSATEARRRLYALIDEVGQSHQPVQIHGKRGNAVLISEADWRSIQETLHLLAIPGMRESILEGMATEASELSTEPGW